MTEDDVRRIVREELAGIGLARGGSVRPGRSYVVGECPPDFGLIIATTRNEQKRRP